MPLSDADSEDWRLAVWEVAMYQQAIFDHLAEGTPTPAEAETRLRRTDARRAKAIEGLARLEMLETKFFGAQGAVDVLENCTALTRLILHHNDLDSFAFFDAPSLSRLVTAVSRLRDLRLHSCELTSDAWSHLGELRDLELFEVHESCRLRARQLRSLASLRASAG